MTWPARTGTTWRDTTCQIGQIIGTAEAHEAINVPLSLSLDSDAQLFQTLQHTGCALRKDHWNILQGLLNIIFTCHRR